MAISTSAYSPKEFQFLIAEQDAFGTIEASGGNAYHALDVDSVGSPSLNPVQGLDVRDGSRVLQATDFFQDVKTSVKEISVSGTATKNALDMLLENIMGEGEGAASSIYTFTSDKAVQQIGTGDGSLVGTALSVVIKSAFGTDADLSFKDCVVTSLALSGDTGTEGGRIKFSATFQTGSTVEDLTEDMFQVFNNQSSGASQGATKLNHQSALAADNFGISMPSSVLTNVGFNEGDIMMLDLSVKALGAGIGSSTALVEVAC